MNIFERQSGETNETLLLKERWPSLIEEVNLQETNFKWWTDYIINQEDNPEQKLEENLTIVDLPLRNEIVKLKQKLKTPYTDEGFAIIGFGANIFTEMYSAAS